MTALQYLRNSGACTTAEIMGLARDDKAAYHRLIEMAAVEMAKNNIPVEAPPPRP